MTTVRQSDMMAASLLIEAECKHLEVLCVVYRTLFVMEELPSRIHMESLDTVIGAMKECVGRISQLIGD